MINNNLLTRLPNRDETIEILKDLPESIQLDEIVQYLYVREQILLGHKDAIERKSYSTEEARTRLKKWLD
jgi:uncharacterized protein YjgD (DUF1641 family)